MDSPWSAWRFDVYCEFEHKKKTKTQRISEQKFNPMSCFCSFSRSEEWAVVYIMSLMHDEGTQNIGAVFGQPPPPPKSDFVNVFCVHTCAAYFCFPHEIEDRRNNEVCIVLRCYFFTSNRSKCHLVILNACFALFTPFYFITKRPTFANYR